MTYTGSVYIGVVGPEMDYAASRDSIDGMVRRAGDSGPHYCRATKGYEARQKHVNKFLNESEHAFILLLDHDMVFAPDTLERLRSHGLPYVSGLYMRRTFAPVAPVWYRPFQGMWPMEPWIGEPERGLLHPIGASGWGCVLVHRDVFTAVKPLLKGEPFVLEDDMDVWPYDLSRIMGAIHALRRMVDSGTADIGEFGASVAALETEIKPLRADSEIVGSDIRFPFFAAKAGFQLYGDPEVRPAHNLIYPLSPDDYSGTTPAQQAEMYAAIHTRTDEDRARLAAQRAALGGAQ